jgi:hypothetical protein
MKAMKLTSMPATFSPAKMKATHPHTKRMTPIHLTVLYSNATPKNAEAGQKKEASGRHIPRAPLLHVLDKIFEGFRWPHFLCCPFALV